MPSAHQPQQIDTYRDDIFPAYIEEGAPLDYRHNSRGQGYAAHQVQQLFAPGPCAQAWTDIMLMDIRFVGALAVNHLRQRAIVTCHSASAEPSIVVPGAEVHILAQWDSATPSNFGGDGHGWWKVAYVIPDSGDSVDFSSVTGSLRYATWFTCEGDLPTTSGNFSDGVALIYTDDQEYTATFGAAHAEVTVSQAALPKDAVFFWISGKYRTIDDITQTKTFHNADSSFDHDTVKFNSEFLPLEPGGGAASAIDWTTDDRGANEPAMTFTMRYEVDATALVSPGSCRVLATAFGATLRAQCPE